MRVLKTFLLVAVVLALLEGTSTLSHLKDAAARALTSNTETSATEQKTYDRLCPLFEVWSDMDADGRAATTSTIQALANRQAATTQDPAVKAFLDVVPQAVSANNAVASKAARALVERECRAHDN